MDSTTDDYEQNPEEEIYEPELQFDQGEELPFEQEEPDNYLNSDNKENVNDAPELTVPVKNTRFDVSSGLSHLKLDLISDKE